jgi:hypothetical protein
MSQVVTGVTQKLQDLLPDQIGTNKRWTTSALERYIMLADRAVRERTENLVSSQTIPLISGTAAYTLDSEFIDVVAVEYSDAHATGPWDYYLKSATFDDYDRLNLSWRDDGGSRPEWYTLIGAPGLPTAQIHVHRPLTTATTQGIRVWGHRIGTTTTRVPDHVQERAHVPYVMAMLLAGEDPQQAAMWFGRFKSGVEEVARRSVSKYAQPPLNVKMGY